MPASRVPLRDLTPEFAVHLRRVAAQRGINQTEAARQLGLSRTHVQRLFSGVFKSVSVANYARLAAWSGWEDPWDRTVRRAVEFLREYASMLECGNCRCPTQKLAEEVVRVADDLEKGKP